MAPPLRDRLELAFSQLVAAQPPWLTRAIAGRPIEIDGQRMHPEAQAITQSQARLGLDRVPPTIERERAEIARGVRLGRGPVIEIGAVEEVTVAGAEGELPARLYVPERDAAPGALVVWFHGGGYCAGTLDSHDQACRLITRESRARVLSVDYRIAPEARFPAAFEDGLTAFRAVVADPRRYGADPERISIGGDSAGGGLAAAVAVRSRDDGGPAPATQVLVYPLCDASRTRRSHELFSQGVFPNRERLEHWRSLYADPVDRADPRVSPLLAEDLAGLPPTYLLLAGFCPLRDEGFELAERLREAGVGVDLMFAGDLPHSFLQYVGVSKRCVQAVSLFAERLR